MLISWIKQFIRVSVKEKFYSIVNTVGLAIGFTSTIIILLWADFQMNFDSFHADYHKIFLAYELNTFANGDKLYSYTTPGPLSGILSKKFPEISGSARYKNGSAYVGVGDKAFNEYELGFVDSAFFSILKVEFISGNRKECFRDLNSIVLTEQFAKKIFNTTDVIGRSVRLNGKHDLMVTGVIKDYPRNSIFSFSSLIPCDRIQDFGTGGVDQWGVNSFFTIVKLKNVSNIEGLERNIKLETNKMGAPEIAEFRLYPLEKCRIYNPDPNGFSYILIIAILVSVAGFVLILACINFINLITARAANRAKEVGIRKVIGSSRVQLIAQYFMESFLNTILALFIAILLVDLVLPTFNATLGTELTMNFSDFHFWSKIIVVVLSVGFIAGIYPALVLSSFQPAKVLKGALRSGAKGAGFRKTMVIIQYTLTITLVVMTFFIFKQLVFISNLDTGMSRKNAITIPLGEGSGSSYKSFSNELRSIPNVKFVTGIEHLPFQIHGSSGDVSWKGKDTSQLYQFVSTATDEFYKDALEMKMVEGRFYSSEYPSDTSSIVINETAANIIDKKPILGEIITINSRNHRIIGVIKDFNFAHFTEKIKPLLIQSKTKGFNYALIKTQKQIDLGTIEQIKKVYSRFYPGLPFESYILEDDFQQMFSIERQLKSILSEFSIIAILISCLGLLSLAAYIAEQQRKSLVIRKIHGASMASILVSQIGSFTKWVLISSVIAIPLSYFAVTGMFSTYTYHTKFSWWVFAIAIGVALLIAVSTVLYQALKTARVNPVEILRYE